MAIDSAQKRMAAINPASPWRGPMVDAAETGFNANNRAAADFMYSGSFDDGGGSTPAASEWLIRARRTNRR